MGSQSSTRGRLRQAWIRSAINQGGWPHFGLSLPLSTSWEWKARSASAAHCIAFKSTRSGAFSVPSLDFCLQQGTSNSRSSSPQAQTPAPLLNQPHMSNDVFFYVCLCPRSAPHILAPPSFTPGPVWGPSAPPSPLSTQEQGPEQGPKAVMTWQARLAELELEVGSGDLHITHVIM